MSISSLLLRQNLANACNFLSSRGHVSAGHGRVGKHRKHPGGRGMAGGQHHLRTNIDKYHPGYFGKVGMRHYHKLGNHYWRPSVNLDKVGQLLSFSFNPPSPSSTKKNPVYGFSREADGFGVLFLIPNSYGVWSLPRPGRSISVVNERKPHRCWISCHWDTPRYWAKDAFPRSLWSFERGTLVERRRGRSRKRAASWSW